MQEAYTAAAGASVRQRTYPGCRESTPSRAVVRSAGFAYRLSRTRLKQEFERHGLLLHVLLRYMQALIMRMARTAVCNRHHALAAY